MAISKIERFLIAVTILSVLYRYATNQWPVSLEIEAE